MRRALFSTILFLVAFAALPARAGEDPGAFITRMADKAIETLMTADISEQERAERFRGLLTEAFHVEAISQFLLGPFRRTATPEEVAAFRDALEDNVVATYAHRFRSYSGQTIAVEAVTDANRGHKIVRSSIDPANGNPPIVVDWRLIPHEDSWKVFDIAIEGLSMIVTQRDEYATIIRNNGGSIEALVSLMNAQTAKLVASR